MLLYDIVSDNTELADCMLDPCLKIPTGLKSIDKAAGRFSPCDIIILVSNESLTRKAFMFNFALINAANIRTPTVIYCSETSKEQTAEQFLKSLGCESIFKNTPLYIEEIGNSSLDELKERITKLKDAFHIENVIIDSMNYAYQHLPDINGQHLAGIKEYIRGMKILAEKLTLTIILTARIINDLELPPEIKAADFLADVLIGIERVADSSEENNKRIITVSRNGQNVAMNIVGFNKDLLTIYDLKENEVVPACK